MFHEPSVNDSGSFPSRSIRYPDSASFRPISNDLCKSGIANTFRGAQNQVSKWESIVVVGIAVVKRGNLGSQGLFDAALEVGDARNQAGMAFGDCFQSGDECFGRVGLLFDGTHSKC